MRILILTGDEDHHFYFCNQIIENTNKVIGVILGGKSVNESKLNILKKIIKKGELKYYIKK